MGYCRLATKNGTWIARTYRGRPRVYESRAFAKADDSAESDGDEVLAYYQAAQRIAAAVPAVCQSSAYSVQEAVGSYLEYTARHRKSIVDARSRLTAYVLPYFGTHPLSSLPPADFEAWSKRNVPKGERKRRRFAVLAAQ